MFDADFITIWLYGIIPAIILFSLFTAWTTDDITDKREDLIKGPVWMGIFWPIIPIILVMMAVCAFVWSLQLIPYGIFKLVRKYQRE